MSKDKVKQFEVVSIKPPMQFPSRWQYRMQLKRNNIVTNAVVRAEDNHPDTVLDGLTKVGLVWGNNSPEQPTEEKDVVRVITIRGTKYEVVNHGTLQKD